jgi:hypothetical protein
MGQPDDALALAELHVREAEERLARQAATTERLAAAGHDWAADEARKMLEPIRMSLDIARAHLAIVRALRDSWLAP